MNQLELRNFPGFHRLHKIYRPGGTVKSSNSPLWHRKRPKLTLKRTNAFENSSASSDLHDLESIATPREHTGNAHVEGEMFYFLC